MPGIRYPAGRALRLWQVADVGAGRPRLG